jgi:YHS domain-containing protein
MNTAWFRIPIVLAGDRAMKTRLLAIASLLAVGALTGSLLAEADVPGKDMKCPLSGKPAVAGATAQHNGLTIYFCCENCPTAFKKNPDRFAAKAHHQAVQTGQLVQVACPFTGKATKGGTEVKVDGVEVAFCCNNCQGKAQNAPDKLTLIFTNISKGFKPAEKK